MSMFRRKLMMIGTDSENIEYVEFEDPKVQAILAENFGDGICITKAQIEAISYLDTAFLDSDIDSFPEFALFTGITQLGINSASRKGTFSGSGIKSIVLPETCKKFIDGATGYGGVGAFFNCKNLNTIDISNVEYIGNMSFYGSENLKNVIVNREEPCTLGTNIFNGVIDFRIYVPDNSVEAYKATTNWSNYADKIYPLSEFVE